MTFHVIVTENAKANLRYYYQRAAENAPLTAGRWLNRFEDALKTLATHPERCSLAPESDAVDAEIRQLIFGKRASAYRALFAISADQVQVLHIRRAAMDVASPDELFD